MIADDINSLSLRLLAAVLRSALFQVLLGLLKARTPLVRAGPYSSPSYNSMLSLQDVYSNLFIHE